MTRRLALLLLLTVAACAAEPPPDEHCSVSIDEVGTVHIDCPDSYVTIPGCEAGLADLNGDGKTDSGDCALVGVADVMRAVCAEDYSPFTNPACRATLRQVLDESSGSGMPPNSVVLRPAFDSEEGSSLAIAFREQLLADNNADGRFGAGEHHDLPGFNDPILAYDPERCLGALDAQAWLLWRDRDCDAVPDADEIVQLVAPDAGSSSHRPQIVLRSNGFVILYVEAVGIEHAVRAWADLDDDMIVDASEIVTLAQDGIPVGIGYKPQSFSDLGIYFRGRPGVDGDLLRVWVPPSDWTFDPEAVADAPASLQSCAAGLAAQLDATACSDRDGRILLLREETAEFMAAASWFPVLSDAPEFTQLMSGRYFVGMSVGTRSHTYLWSDRNDDRYIDDAEIIRRAGGSAQWTRAAFVGDTPTFVGIVPPGVPGVERWVEGHFLGESCADYPHCAGELECRVSGEDPGPRCVPAPAE